MANSRRGLSRRAFLGAFAIGHMGAPTFAAACPGRVVTLDWPSTQNVLALGITPMATPELELYKTLVVEPEAPSSMLELGLRSEPNLELVLQLKPDLIIIGGELASVQERLEIAAPVMSFSADGFDESDPLAKGDAALSSLASRLDRAAAYGAFQGQLAREMSDAKARLRTYDGRPVFILTVIDGRRALVFGRNSLFQSVFDRLGVANAWDGPTTPYGHITVTIDRLAKQTEARLLCVGDSSSVPLDTLLASSVMQSLPFAREGRVARIPDVLFYGGLPSAARFVRLASTALAAG